MEHEFEATIFTPSNSIDWRPTSTRLVWGGFGLLLTFLLLANLYEFDSYVFEASLIGIVMIVFGGIWGSFEKEQPHGKVYGTLRIDEDFITINQTKYDWKEISNFSFLLLNVKNEYLYTTGYRGFGGPAYSAGTDNYIEFTHNSEPLEVFFQIDTKSHYLVLSKAMKYLFLVGKTQLMTTYNGLRLDYEEIQELKKEKAQFNSKSS